MQQPQREITLNDILITEELSRRWSRSPNWQAEAQAMQSLARRMASDSETMLQSLVEMAVELCQAGTAGVSLLETAPDGEETFRARALAGTLAQYVGGSTPRNFSPCGVCLQRCTPVLFSHAERYFTYFQAANTPIVEGLVLPLIADNHAFGTIWIMSHDEQRHFDLEDVRMMTSLADFAATALLLDRRQTRELLAANAVLEAEIVERKQAKKKLRSAQRRLELSLRGANLGVWTYNVATDEFWTDDRAKLLHGHELHEVHNFEESGANIHPEDRDRARAAFAQAILDRSKLQIEYRVIWRDGSVRWIASYAEFIASGARDEGIFYGVVQDISDRKFAEADLHESEARSRALIENLPGEAVFVVDRELRYLLADGKALSVAGFKPEELVGQTIFEVMPPELAANYEALYRKALAGESFELEHNAHDRTYISRGTPLRSADGEVYAVLAVSYDITERKQGEAALSESEARLRLFVTASSDMVYRMSADWREMRNLEGKNILANTDNNSDTWLETYIPQSEQPHVWAVIQEAICTKSIFALEHRVIQQDGTLGWVFSRAIPMLDEQGDIIEWFGAGSDITARKQTEADLRESEEKYRSLFNSMDEGYFLCDVIFDENDRPIDLFYIDENPAAVRMTGQSFRGQRLREISPNYEEYWYEIFGRVAQTGQAERLERYSESDQIWCDFYVFKVGSDDQGRVAVVFNDITERKRAEQVQREGEERQAFLLKLSDALRPIAEPLAIGREASRILRTHLGAIRVGYGEMNKDGMTCTVMAEDMAEGVYSLFGHTYNWTDFDPSGLNRLNEGDPISCEDVQTADDLTPAQKATFAAVGFRAFTIAPLVKSGRLVAFFVVHFDLPHKPAPNEIMLLGETAERTWAAVERARAEVALRESELQRVREQSAREQERQRAETLAELDRAKTLFFSNVSHEFRTPLTLLLAPLQDALSDRTHPLDSVHQERLELVHRNSLRLLKLVNTLLDFSRIEAGRMEAVYEPTDLATYTAELSSVFRSAIDRAGLQLIVDCPTLPEPVFVDREMWEKIVLNLLSNAFKFTFEGEIEVSLRSTDSNQAILQIQDTGSGIAPEHLPHLFERFYQVRGTQARTHDGSGIGLALVHELVRLQGGTIEVSSTVGQGTCFTIALPFGTDHLPSDRLQDEGDRQPTRTLASTAIGAAAYVEEAKRWLPTQDNQEQTIENAKKQTTQTADSSLPTLTSARVLVVDDNADMREYLTRILSDRVQVEAVADGATALTVLQEQVPDLILSDVMMPGLDGFELLGALRADPRTREVPIILLSARAGEEAIVVGLEAGADDYLSKPFSAQELISRVLAHLQMAHLRGEALQEARSTIRSRDEFISFVSHELNTPLVSILGWTRLLRTNSPSPTMLTKALDTIERNATLQAKLVQDLLDISRIAAGKLRLNAEPVELEAVIETAMATVTQMAQTKGIDLKHKKNMAHQDAPNANSIIVMGDRDRLGQVICNLLSNAIKFTPQSGSVTIELSVIDNDHSPNISCAQICVTDTGIGIAADFLPHVFERFRQARDSDAAKGLGLGLAIARHLVELHNGTISARSAGVGQGATFTVKLPLCLS